LLKIKNILLRYKSETLPTATTSEQINNLIESGTFDNADSFMLGGKDNA
jgi:hypothetical protein